MRSEEEIRDYIKACKTAIVKTKDDEMATAIGCQIATAYWILELDNIEQIEEYDRKYNL